MSKLMHCIGSFETKDKISLEQEFDEKYILENLDSIRNSAKTDDKTNDYSRLLHELRDPKYHNKLIKANLVIVKQLVSRTVSEDTFIIQSINSIEELDRVCNVLAKRLKEWYGYYFPELSQNIQDNEVFVQRILQKTKEEFMQEYSINVSMGPQIQEKDLNAIIDFARQINDLFLEREKLMSYLEEMMKKYCPNVERLAGSIIGAKLLEKSGSLKHMSELPSSTIQLLGAEQALFRHLRNKSSRPPKHGLILSHPIVMDAKYSNRGKMARALAGKISIAAKVDYFKGEFIGDKLRENLENRKQR